MRLLTTTVCLLVCSAALLYSQTTTTDSVLEIAIDGIENQRGRVNYLLFASEYGFPSDRQKAVAEGSAEISDSSIRVQIDDLPHGEYAVSILHDEDENDLMRTGLFGIPREGYGFSNDAPLRFGPPHYRDAAFLVESPRVEITIRMRYRR